MSKDKQTSNKPLGHPVEHPDDDTKPLNYYRLEDDIRNLSGKILTIVDASIADKQQNKALKDLIKREIRDLLRQYQNYFWDGKQGHSINL